MKKTTQTGIIVRGLCISSTAVVRTRRDGSGTFVSVREELALRPGLAIMERFYDPSIDKEVKVQGDQVIDYPKLEDFVAYEITVNRYAVDKEGHMLIRDGLANRIDE